MRRSKSNIQKMMIFILILTGIVLSEISLAQEGMISYWKLDEGTGSVAIDCINGNNGTINGATWTTGIVDNALSFDGVNDYVRISSSSSIILGATDFTLEAWIKTTDPEGNIFFHYNSGGYYFVLNSGGKLLGAVRSPSAYLKVFSNNTVNDGYWHHVVFIRHYNEKLELYIDGILDNSLPEAAGDISKSLPLDLGRDTVHGFPWFEGNIDEVAIYSRALTQEEIQQRYQQGINQPPNCSGASIADQTAGPNCQATISGADVSGVTDPDNDPLTITVSPTTLLLGTNTVTVTAEDGNDGICSTDITVNVIDDTPPTLTTITDPIELWPPNGNYVTIDVSQRVLGVSDNCTTLSSSDVVITKVTSDEPEDLNGSGDGKTKNDIVIASNCQSVYVRRERQGGGNGRVYTIHLSVEDGSGNSTTASFQVHVPHSQNGGLAVDDGPIYEVIGTCTTVLKHVRNEDQVTGKEIIPEGIALLQNYPNPFNPTTIIQYDLPVAGFVTMKVFDLLGNEVALLVNENKGQGRHQVSFDASTLSSGVYIYLIRVNEFVEIKKMLLMK